MSTSIDITLKGVEPDRDLLQSTRWFCDIIGGSLADTSDWAIVLEAIEATGEPRYRASVHVRSDRGTLHAVETGSEPAIAVQRSLAAVLRSSGSGPALVRAVA